MEIIFFIYGLSFFTFGILVLFVRPKESNIFFANKIWLLGVFAILHAIVEWIAMYKFVYPISIEFLTPFEVGLLLLSYLALFEFSRFILRKSFENPHSKLHFIYHLYAGPVVYVISIAALLFLIILHPGLNETIVAIRYTYGFWGSLFLGIGLYFYADAIKTTHKKKLEKYFKLGGIAFICYAFFAGIIVPPSQQFPANILNSEWFLTTLHIPVQIFRTICALTIAVTSVKILEIFKYEIIEKLNESFTQIKEFNSNASHQLKTPLSSIKVQLDVTLQQDRNVDEYKKILRSIGEDITHLHSMLHNLLLLTRMRDDTIKEQFVDVEIDSLLLNAISQYMLIATKKKISLHVNNLDPLKIKADVTLMEILITNLIDNAIKYTPNGKSIYIDLKNDTLNIHDEGIGIEEDKLLLIFNKFYQVDTSNRTTSSGYGLGLPMVKKIADLHKATLYVKSKVNIGTTMTVKF